ncbi:ribose ABC transport system [Desulfocucumis palustris]|uniref:Ribose ABC transport system n=1 Tax=Desulfocucumis palustris TaxID=1898651 RepID=A0A2L2XDG2_9FIRM|nr:substrate-binding domain-containing protein [Desulfocucumis palustris]GBF34278.1 ribose ABC transport system [Desulfocucumis palustris]
MKKRFFALAVSLMMMGVLLAGCGGGEQSKETGKDSEKQIVIGFSQYTLGAPYFVEIVNAAKKEAEAQGCKFISVDAQDNINKQLADVEDLLAQQIDLLILNAKDPVGAVPAVKQAKEAGVPVIEVDSSIDPSAPVVTTIQSNNDENGKLVGKWLAGQLKGKPIKAALISGAQGNPVGQARRDGVFAGVIFGQNQALGKEISDEQAAKGAQEVEEQLKNTGKSNISDAKFQIVAQGWGNWAHEGGLKAMEDILVANPDINVLITENDSMALGALEAIKEAKKENQILVVAAADGQKEALALIKEGKYGATGMNNPAIIGKTAVEVGLKALKGDNSFPEIYYTPPVAINKENVDQYYNPDAGF